MPKIYPDMSYLYDYYNTKKFYNYPGTEDNYGVRLEFREFPNRITVKRGHQIRDFPIYVPWTDEPMYLRATEDIHEQSGLMVDTTHFLAKNVTKSSLEELSFDQKIDEFW